MGPSPAADRDFTAHTEAVLASPRDAARVELLVRRPVRDGREVVAEARLDPVEGLVGDDWLARGMDVRVLEGGPVRAGDAIRKA